MATSETWTGTLDLDPEKPGIIVKPGTRPWKIYQTLESYNL